MDNKKSLTDLRGELGETTAKSCSELATVSRESVVLQSERDSLQQYLKLRESELVSLEQQKEQLRVKCDMVSKELVEVKGGLALEMEGERRRHESEKLQLQQRLKALASKSRAGEQKALELLRAQEDIRTQWQDELMGDKRDMELTIEKLKKQCLQYKMGYQLRLKNEAAAKELGNGYSS